MWRLSVACFCLAASSAAFAANNRETTLQTTMKELEAQRSKADEISKKSKKVTRELSALQKDSSKLVQTIRAKQERIASNQAEIKQLSRERSAKQALLHDRREQLEKLLSGMIRMRRIPAQYVSAQPVEMHRLLQTASALNITYRATHEAFNAINLEFAQLERLSERLDASQKQLSAQLQSVQLQQKELTSLIKQRRILQQSLQRDHLRIARRVKELSDKSGDLQELIARLEAETSLFQQLGTPRQKPSIPKPTQQTLLSRKGKLPYPAAGKLLHHFGEKRRSGGRYQGLELKTSASAPVTAPHGGKIVFSGSFMDYGAMVIIEHDDAYHSVIAGLDVVAAQPGQPITSGELIGTMGASDSGRTLYYELRKHSKAIDPAAWMGNVKLATRN